MIRPRNDNVLLVLYPDVPEVSASGIVGVRLKDPSKAYGQRQGVVLAAGPGHVDQRGRFQPTEVQPGDRVVIEVTAGDRYAYTKRQDFADMYAPTLAVAGIPFDSAEFRMVRNDELLAVIESSEVREGSAAAE